MRKELSRGCRAQDFLIDGDRPGSERVSNGIPCSLMPGSNCCYEVEAFPDMHLPKGQDRRPGADGRPLEV